MKEKRALNLKPLWIIAIATMVILLLCHSYNDILVTARHGMNLWYSLFQGKFLEVFPGYTQSGNLFYSVEQGMAYNILIYIIFAVWNIPLVLLEIFTNIDIMNCFPCLIYIKLLPVGAMVLSAYILLKILELASPDGAKKQLLTYLYLSSSLMLSVIFIISQYDILGVLFQLAGVYAFLKKDKKKFILFFGIAFCFKYFALLIFIPLLLLWDKKIQNILLDLLLLVIPLILTKLPFIFSAGSNSADLSLTITLAVNLFKSATSYVFVFVYVLILVGCYLKKDSPDVKQSLLIVSVICFAGYASFFGLMNAYPYWSIMMAPFVVLLLACIPSEYFRTGLIAETFSLVCLVFGNMLRYQWCYWGNTMKPMLLSKLLKGVSYEGGILYRIIGVISHHGFAPTAVFMVFCAGSAALLFFAYRGLKNKQAGEPEQGITDILYLRMIVSSGLCLLPILSNFI